MPKILQNIGMSFFFTVINLITIIQYECQLHTKHCTSFNIVHQPKVFSCKITLAGSPFQISAAVASQVCLNLLNILKLQGLTKHEHSAGFQG